MKSNLSLLLLCATAAAAMPPIVEAIIHHTAHPGDGYFADPHVLTLIAIWSAAPFGFAALTVIGHSGVKPGATLALLMTAACWIGVASVGWDHHVHKCGSSITVYLGLLLLTLPIVAYSVIATTALKATASGARKR